MRPSLPSNYSGYGHIGNAIFGGNLFSRKGVLETQYLPGLAVSENSQMMRFASGVCAVSVSIGMVFFACLEGYV